MSIGDGYVSLRRDRVGKVYTANLVMVHCQEQLEYLKHKCELLHSIFGGNPPNIVEQNSKSGYKLRTAYRANKAHKYFLLIHRWLYSNNNKKYITEHVLTKLTPQGIAIWYMDDGGVSRTKHNGKITSVECRISTYCSEVEVDCILKYFLSVWGIQWKKRFCKRTSLWFIACNTTEARKFEALIEKYIIPSMEYKLPKAYLGKSAEQPVRVDDMVRSYSNNNYKKSELNALTIT